MSKVESTNGASINACPQKRFSMPEISQQEFCEHIEQDNFFITYGNPVTIQTESGEHVVCMSAAFYERITGEKIELPKGKD